MDQEFKLYGNWQTDCETRLVGLIAHDDQGRLLMQLRDDYENIPSPGRWALFGGHVDEGEEIYTAILREIKEELKLEWSMKDLTPLARYIFTSRKAQIYLFAAQKSVSAQDISLGEGAGFAFLNRHQVLNFELAASVAEFLRNYMMSTHPKRNPTGKNA